MTPTDKWHKYDASIGQSSPTLYQNDIEDSLSRVQFNNNSTVSDASSVLSSHEHDNTIDGNSTDTASTTSDHQDTSLHNFSDEDVDGWLRMLRKSKPQEWEWEIIFLTLTSQRTAAC